MARLFRSLLASLLLFQMTGRPATSTAPFGKTARAVRAGQQSTELDEAILLNQKVIQLFEEGRSDEALPLAKRVLQIREKALGRDHQLVIEALLNLAELNLSKGSYREALSLYGRVLKSNEKQAGPDDPSNVVLLDKMAYLSYMTGYSPGAENYYKRSLAISEKVYSQDSEQVAQSLYNLAEFYRFTGSYKKAESFFSRALEIRDRTLKPDDPKLLRTVERYRCLFYQSDRMDRLKAFEVEREALYKSGDEGAPGEVINGKAITLPKPFYPPEARAARAKGIIVIKVAIDERGAVVKAQDMCGGNPWLVQVSTEAALKARFSPALREGQPVKVTGVVTYKFAF